MFGFGLAEVLLPFWLLGQTSNSPPPSLQTGPERAIASYTLSAKLDEKEHRIEGEGRISFLNASTKPVARLYFHLYLNAFENTETLFLRSGDNRSGAKLGRPGFISISSLTSPDFPGVNLWDEASAHSPGDPKDRTDIYVPLPRPLPVGETLELDVSFVSQLPEAVERTGYVGDFHLVAQWYPKLAKHEPDGHFEHFSFHPAAEFYADFGDYRVTLDVPENYQVGTTGTLTKAPALAHGRTRWIAFAAGVHDFAWVAARELEVEERQLGPVSVRVLTPPNTTVVKKKTWSTLDSALRNLGEHYGPYPYSTLTVVHPPKRAMRTGGMEYPSLITTGGSEITSRLNVRSIELIVVHELAHQWFQSALASNEARFPFLDEGLTSYAEWRYLDEVFGEASVADLPFFPVSRLPPLRMVQGRRSTRQAISTAARDFHSFSSLARIVYSRTPLCLETLRRVYSAEKVDQALKAYAHKYRFLHPKPEDLYSTLEEYLGSEAREITQTMFEKNGWVDFQVTGIQTERKSSGYRTTVSVSRRGSLQFPVTVRLGLQNGKTLDRSIEFNRGLDFDRGLDAAKKKWTLTFDHSSPVSFAEVDPNRNIIIDENLINNRLRLDKLHSSLDASQGFGSAVFGLRGFGAFATSLLAFLLAVLSP